MRSSEHAAHRPLMHQCFTHRTRGSRSSPCVSSMSSMHGATCVWSLDCPLPRVSLFLLLPPIPLPALPLQLGEHGSPSGYVHTLHTSSVHKSVENCNCWEFCRKLQRSVATSVCLGVPGKLQRGWWTQTNVAKSLLKGKRDREFGSASAPLKQERFYA